MSALVLGPAEKELIAELRERASAAPIGLDRIKAMSDGFDPDDPASRKGREDQRVSADFTIDLPGGFRVTYTLEQQPPGLCRHLSISVGAPGRAPSPHAIAALMQEFGFRATEGAPLDLGPQMIESAAALGRLYVYSEKYEGPDLIAVNLIEQIGGASLASEAAP